MIIAVIFVVASTLLTYGTSYYIHKTFTNLPVVKDLLWEKLPYYNIIWIAELFLVLSVILGIIWAIKEKKIYRFGSGWRRSSRSQKTSQNNAGSMPTKNATKRAGESMSIEDATELFKSSLNFRHDGGVHDQIGITTAGTVNSVGITSIMDRFVVDAITADFYLFWFCWSGEMTVE